MRLPTLSLQYRITLSVAIGVLVLLVGIGYLGYISVQDSRDAAKEERLAAAQSLAAHVDSVLDRAAGRLTAVSAQIAAAWDGGEPPSTAQLQTFHGLLYRASVRVIDNAAQPRALVGDDPFPDAAPVGVERTAFTPSGTASLVPCDDTSGRALLCLRSPITGATEEFGTLEMHLDLRSPELRLLDETLVGAGATAELLGDDAAIILATPSPRGVIDHTSALTDAIDVGEDAVAIHDQGGSDHLVAYTPLETLPGWGIAVEQDRDVALAAADRLQERFIIFGVIALTLAVVLAWFDVRQVVRPLRGLIGRADAMAGGDLRTSVDTGGRGEVGELGMALETMRAHLDESIEEIARRDRELEDRVRERTAEAARLYQELQIKEEARTQLLDKVIRAQEEERARLARELHDETAQALTAIGMSLEATEGQIGADPAEARLRMSRVRDLTSRALDELRDLIGDLRPSALDDLGLVPAVRMLGEDRLEDRGVEVVLTSSGMSTRLDETTELGLYRIVQEAVSNIARHAHAAHASIEIRRTDDAVTVTVSDDGDGFAVDEQVPERTRGRGLGLLGMRERAALLGGTVQIDSASGQGTTVRVTLPLPSGNTV